MSTTFTPSPVPLARPVAMVGVFLFQPNATVRYTLLPNVRVLSIEAPGEGAHPGSARFRYSFASPYNDPNDPSRFEQVYPLDATGNRVVNADDRLVVRAYLSNGSFMILFDGFVQIPQADVGRESELVTFQAIGTPIREWDTPLRKAIYRDGSDPYTGQTRTIDAPIRFNPDGQPNATPAARDVNQGQANAYPVFFDERIVRNPEVRDYWTVGSAAQYVVFNGNPDETYVKNPISNDLDTLLMARQATPDPNGVINLSDQSTYGVVAIECPDLDVTGDPWPVALAKLIEPFGFGMCFRLDKDPSGDPEWTFEVYFKDDNVRVKTIGLQAAGSAYDPSKTNVGELHLARDGAEIANYIILDTAPIRYEACFILSPGFSIAATDADAANFGDATNPGKWDVQDPSKSPVRVTDWVTYRLFIFGEAGDPYWDFSTSSLSQTIPSLNLVFGTPDVPEPVYARRRRVPHGALFSKDSRGDPYRAELYVTHDGLYTGLAPAVWKPTAAGVWEGTWHKVKSGGWELLDDQLGIRLTHRTVEGWPIGPGTVFPDGKLRVVTSLANPTSRATNPDSTTPRIIFMLLCTIDGDAGLGVEMKRRAASPTIFDVIRHDDVRDRFAKRVVCASSMYSTGPTTAILDETDKAKAYAAARRRSRELGSFAGSVTIPRLSLSYQVGDKISRIKGRDVSLRQNAAAAAGESDVYPTVVGITWNFEGGQSTTLSLGDRRAGPPPERRNPRMTADRPDA